MFVVEIVTTDGYCWQSRPYGERRHAQQIAVVWRKYTEQKPEVITVRVRLVNQHIYQEKAW